jgi:DNA-directed RNA polymerase specialized sigma24 family protein
MSCAVGTVKSTAARGLERLRTTLGPSWALEQP